MKNSIKWLLLLSLCIIGLDVFATDYYSVRSGAVHDTNTWNSSRDGSGSAPTDFNNPEDNFIIQEMHVVYNTKQFICAGSMFIEAGGVFDGYSSSQTQIRTVVAINSGGTFRLQQSSALQAGFVLVQGLLENNGGSIQTGLASLQPHQPVQMARR